MSTCLRPSGIERINTRYSNQWKSHPKAVREYTEKVYGDAPKMIIHAGLYESYVFSGLKFVKILENLLCHYEKTTQQDLMFLRLNKQREFWLKTFTPATQKAIKALFKPTTQKKAVNALVSKRHQRVLPEQPTLTFLGIPFQSKWSLKIPQKLRALIHFLVPCKE